MQLDMVPDWINAAGTLLAVAVASAAGIVAYKGYRIQSEDIKDRLEQGERERRERQQSRRREQADQVAYWLVFDRPDWNVHYVNSSTLPVWNVLIHIVGETFDFIIDRGVEGPASARKSRRLTYRLNELLSRSADLDTHHSAEQVNVEATFTDSAGVRWHRDTRGTMVEVPADFTFRGTATSQWPDES